MVVDINHMRVQVRPADQNLGIQPTYSVSIQLLLPVWPSDDTVHSINVFGQQFDSQRYIFQSIILNIKHTLQTSTVAVKS